MPRNSRMSHPSLALHYGLEKVLWLPHHKIVFRPKEFGGSSKSSTRECWSLTHQKRTLSLSIPRPLWHKAGSLKICDILLIVFLSKRVLRKTYLPIRMFCLTISGIYAYRKATAGWCSRRIQCDGVCVRGYRLWKNTHDQVLLSHALADFSGTPDQPGLIYLTKQELFERCASLTDKKVEISLSFLEIYNETIRDLLVPIEDSKGLMLREDAEHRISVPGLTTASPATVAPVK